MKTLATILLSCVAVTTLIAISGCEAESVSDSKVAIKPSSAKLAKGESVELVATGGYEYTWRLAEGGNAWGSLSTLTGDRTVYTSLADSTSSNAAPVVQTVYVSSSISGAGSPSNATEQSYADINTAEAYITHTVASDTDGVEDLVLRPNSVDIHAGEIKEFTASGGTGSYAWSITPSHYGALSSSSGNKVAYVSSNAVVTVSVAITVTSGSQSEISIINHKP